MTENLHQIYQHMYRNFDAEAVATLSARVAWDCSKLEQEANQKDKLAWRMKPKLRMMQELLEYQAYELGNPRGTGNTATRTSSGSRSSPSGKGALQPPAHVHRASWIGTGRF